MTDKNDHHALPYNSPYINKSHRGKHDNIIMRKRNRQKRSGELECLLMALEK